MPGLLPLAAAAQGFPDRGLRLIIPFPPGGAADFLGRVVEERMARGLAQPVTREAHGVPAGVTAKVPCAARPLRATTEASGGLGSRDLGPIFPQSTVPQLCAAIVRRLGADDVVGDAGAIWTGCRYGRPHPCAAW